MINSLRRKFIMVNMICVTLILVVVFVAIFMVNSKQLKSDSLMSLERALNFTSGQIPGQVKLSKDGDLKEYEASSFVINVDYDGTPTLISANNINLQHDNINDILPYSQEKMAQILNKAINSYYDGQSTGELKTYKLRYAVDESMNGVNIAFMDITNEYSQKKQMLLACLVAGIISFCGFFLVSFFLSRWALRPVEKAWENQKRFAADASHELRTPLTVILANMEILKTNKDQKIEDQMEWVDNTEAEATRMKNLAGNLLFLAKNGDMKKPAIVERVNISDAVTKTTLAFEPVAFERKIAIDTFIQSDIYIGGDENQIRQLTTILLDNAIKYSYDDTTINVTLKDAAGKAVLEVNNTGVPIAQEDLASIFERFYRSDKSRAEEGYGLGLSIAKNIADQHKASISASSNEKDGTTFTVIFPSYKS